MAFGKPSSLRLLAFLLIGSNLIFFMFILFFVFPAMMSPLLLQSETKSLARQRDLVSELLSSATDTTYLLAENTATWEETVRLVESDNPDDMIRNWPDTSLLQRIRRHFIIFKDTHGKDVYIDFHDYIKNRKLPVPAGFSASLEPIAQSVLSAYDTTAALPPGGERGKKGIVFFDTVPYSIAVLPIIPSRGAEKPSGTLILGNILDNDYFHDLTRDTGSLFELVSIEEGEADTSTLSRPTNRNSASIEMPLKDINANPVIQRIIDTSTIHSAARFVPEPTVFVLVIAMTVFAIILYMIVTHLTLRPIERLSRDIERMTVNDGLKTETYSRSREFAILCSAINGMLRRLNETHISTDVLRRILNGIDASLYVSDPSNNEVLFSIDTLTKHPRVETDTSDPRYTTASTSGSPEQCGSHPHHGSETNPDGIVTWEEKNPETGRSCRHTDRMIEWDHGRMVCLRHSVDITEARIAEETLKRRLRQQELMSAMSQSFIWTHDIPTLIRDALRITGEFTGISRIMLGRLEHGADPTVNFEYEWYNDNQNVTHLKEKTYRFYPGEPIRDALINEKITYLSCDDISGIDEFAHLTSVGVKAFMAVPVHVSGSLWGVMTFDDCIAPRIWSDSDIQLISLISNVISSVVTRSITEERLIRMSSIVDSSPQGISYIGKDGRFEYFNQGMLTISGYSAEELNDMGIAAIFDPETYAYALSDIFPFVQKEGRKDFELPIIRKDGEKRILTISAFKTAFKRVGLGVIASDITEKRQLEKDLITAKEQAEQSSRAKGEFLSRMSHEMRTPMNVIIGMTAIARSSKDQEKKESCLDKIDDASKHLLSVINDILDISKIEANKFELSNTEFNFETMLMHVVNVFTFRIDEKNQNLIVNIDKNVPRYIISDDQRLGQIITNLLSNAVKFTPEKGTIILSVSTLDEKDGLLTLRIAITDTGIGIPPEQQSKLFRSFEQADGSISRKYGGTGLGLAISKNIVEMMQGRIWVESEVTKGSSFIFEIKARLGTRLQNLLYSGINWKNLHVLAVSADPDVRECFLTTAQSTGFSCAVAADGCEAMHLIEENRETAFDIAFVDWKMPKMNGIELFRKIKDEAGPKMVVLMIAAAQWKKIRQAVKISDIDGFITKPLSMSGIVDCVNERMAIKLSPSPDATPEMIPENCFRAYRLLLVEDIEINREIVIAMLEHTGIEIESAENGEIAVSKLRDNPSHYDAIFMDIHMPEMDGYEAAGRIRALDIPEARSIPIIAMTANVFREDIEKCLAAGMNDHIGKPITAEEMYRKLKKYLPQDVVSPE